MRVNDLLRMELMAECLGKRPAFLVQERAWSPSSSTTLLQQHLELSRILFGGRLQYGAHQAEQVSNTGNWERF